MARDNKARLQLELVLLALDGARPSGTLQWASAAAPVVTQAAVGAGHWAAGRRQRALAAWASAAGSALAAWGLGTEAPTRAEMVREHPAAQGRAAQARQTPPPGSAALAGTQTHLSQRSQNALAALIPAQIVVGVVFGVRSGLRHPRQLTAHTIASETFSTVDLCPAGGPGHAAAQAEDRRRPSPVRRIASPAPGGIG